MTASDIIAQELQLLVIMALITLVVAVLGIVGGSVLSKRIVKPLSILAEDMGQIRNLQLTETDLGKSGILEVQTMETALSNMKKGLRSFKRYVPSDVVAQLINREVEDRLGTEIHSITSFFSDLENFTKVSEKLGPDLVTKLLGPYLKALTELQQSWADLDIPPLRTRIGINTGEALVGNIGFEERLSYTALGDTMNLAARLESLNKLYGTTVLVGESTFKATNGSIPGRLVDKVAVKGKTLGTEIYEIFWEDTLPKDWDRFLVFFQEAFGFYQEGAFQKALDSLARAHHILPNDGPTKILAGRAKRYLESPPESPADWNGVTVLQEK